MTATWKPVFFTLAILGIAIACFAGDADIKLSTSDGSTKLSIINSGAVSVATIDSRGGIVSSSITVIGTGIVNISSNTILPGTTFYQAGKVTIASATANGFFGLQARPKASIRGAIQPNAVGQMFYCTDCAATSLICVSTGTAANTQWATAASSSVMCN